MAKLLFSLSISFDNNSSESHDNRRLAALYIFNLYILLQWRRMDFGQTFFSLPNAALQATIPFQSKKNYLVDLHKLFCGSLSCIRLRGEIRTILADRKPKGQWKLLARYKNAETIIKATQVTQIRLSR